MARRLVPGEIGGDRNEDRTADAVNVAGKRAKNRYFLGSSFEPPSKQHVDNRWATPQYRTGYTPAPGMCQV